MESVESARERHGETHRTTVLHGDPHVDNVNECQWYKLYPIWGSNMANAMVRMRLEPPIVLAWNGSVIGPPYGILWLYLLKSEWLNVNSPQVAQPLLQNSKQWFGFHMFSLGWIFRSLLLPFVANILRVWYFHPHCLFGDTGFAQMLTPPGPIPKWQRCWCELHHFPRCLVKPKSWMTNTERTSQKINNLRNVWFLAKWTSQLLSFFFWFHSRFDFRKWLRTLYITI